MADDYRLSRRLFLSTVAVTTLGSTTASGQTLKSTVPWPQYQADERNTGTVTNWSGPREVQFEWAFRYGGKKPNATVNSPVVAHNTVFSVNYDILYAIDMESGEEIWQQVLPEPTITSPAVSESAVFIGGGNGLYYSFDIETGEKNWTFITSGGVVDTANAYEITIHDGVVYLGSLDRAIYAVDAESGDEIWQFNTFGFVDCAVAVDTDSVYVGSDSYYLFSLDKETGNEQWRYEASDWIDSAPTIFRDKVVFADQTGEIYAVDKQTGNLAWSYNTGADEIIGSVVVNDGTTFVSSINPNSVQAVDMDAQSQIWEFQADQGFIAAPVLIDDIIYIGARNGTFYALNSETGNEVWRYETTGEKIFATAVVLEDWVFFPTEYQLYALKRGNQVPEIEIDVSPENPEAGEETHITTYVDTDGSTLYYEWDVDGDGNFEIEGEDKTHVSHHFESQGPQNVRLRVTDNNYNSYTTEETILVYGPPDASFDSTPEEPIRTQSVQFDATASSSTTGNITGYEWDIDDDGNFEQTGENFTTEFNETGTRLVTLRVRNDGDITANVTKDIVVRSGEDEYLTALLAVLSAGGATGAAGLTARYLRDI